jgi:hypothetical protein
MVKIPRQYLEMQKKKILVMFIDKNIKAVFSCRHNLSQLFVIICATLPSFFQYCLQQDNIFPSWTLQHINLCNNKSFYSIIHHMNKC